MHNPSAIAIEGTTPGHLPVESSGLSGMLQGALVA
jgi:hypothetical protein